MWKSTVFFTSIIFATGKKLVPGNSTDPVKSWKLFFKDYKQTGESVIEGESCTGTDCRSEAECPTGTHVRKCEVLGEKGVGSYIASEGSMCIAQGNWKSIGLGTKAKATCSPSYDHVYTKHKKGSLIGPDCNNGDELLSCTIKTNLVGINSGGFLALNGKCKAKLPNSNKKFPKKYFINVYSVCGHKSPFPLKKTVTPAPLSDINDNVEQDKHMLVVEPERTIPKTSDVSTESNDEMKCLGQERFNEIMCNSHVCNECSLKWCTETCQKLQDMFPTCRCNHWSPSRKSFSGGDFAGKGGFGDKGDYSNAKGGDGALVRLNGISAFLCNNCEECWGKNTCEADGKYPGCGMPCCDGSELDWKKTCKPKLSFF